MTDLISSFSVIDTFSKSPKNLKVNNLTITGNNHRIGINSALSGELREKGFCVVQLVGNKITGEIAFVFTKDKNAQGHEICFRNDAKGGDINSKDLALELKRLFKCPAEGNATITIKPNASKIPEVMFFIIEDIKPLR